MTTSYVHNVFLYSVATGIVRIAAMTRGTMRHYAPRNKRKHQLHFCSSYAVNVTTSNQQSMTLHQRLQSSTDEQPKHPVQSRTLRPPLPFDPLPIQAPPTVHPNAADVARDVAHHPDGASSVCGLRKQARQMYALSMLPTSTNLQTHIKPTSKIISNPSL